MTHTVITAAGDSRALFIASGFGRPKSLVLWEGKPVLACAVDSYVLDPGRACVAISAAEDDEWHIGEALLELIPDLTVRSIPAGARGALASALMALEGMDPAAPLVVAAGDSMITGGISGYVSEFIEAGVAAATIAFPSANPRWSYLSVDDVGRVRQVAEKRVIGPLATTGVFYYRTVQEFVDAATWCLVNNASLNGVFYVSTTLNYLVSRGEEVAYARIQRSEYRSWSLPIDFTTQTE